MPKHHGRIRSRRVALRLVVFSALGAVVTVAVAWGIAYFAPFGTHAGQNNERGYHAYFDAAEDWAYIWLDETGKSLGTVVHPEDVQHDRLASGRSESPPSWVFRSAAGFGYDPVDEGIVDYAFGFPFRSLGSRIVGTWTPGSAHRFVGGWPTGEWLSGLPFRPIWPGLVGNTVIYGATFWLLLVVIRRALSSKHRALSI